MAGRGRGAKGNNAIYGSSGDDTLSGIGGSFELIGGKGDDTYIVDDAGDKVSEKNRSGTDHVISSVDFALGSYLEDLTLAGSEDISGTGNESANIITGNAGANLLNGLGGDDTLDGGAGSDVVDGGDGADTAVFDGLLSDYFIELDGTDLRVTDNSGETDILRNVELLAFGDITLNADDLENPGPPAPPVAANDAAASAEDNAIVIAVLANDTGDGLSIATVSNGTAGQVSVNNDGTLTYTPNANSHGQDSFSYTVTDSMGQASSASVVVNVASVNDAPVAIADSYVALAGEVFTSTGSVLDNDSDVDGDALNILTHDAASLADGTVEMNPDGSFSFTAAGGFAGTDSFTYTVDDGSGGQATATVTIDVETVPPPPDPEDPPYYVEGLLYPQNWNRLNYPDDVGTAVTVTFAFAETTPDYYDLESFAWNNFQTFSDEQRATTRQALEDIANFSGLTFIETELGQAEIVFGIADVGFSGFAFSPSSDGVGDTDSDVWIDDALTVSNFIPGTEAYKTLIHEIGHAIGLSHATLPTEENTRQFTVMTAYPHPTMSGEPQTHMLYDVAALQHLYGANTSYATGDNSYEFGELNDVVQTIWDAGGRDIFDLSAATYGVDIDLRDGSFSTIAQVGSNNLAIAFGTVIEDVIGGAYNDTISGNDSANHIGGGGGDDLLTGRGGGDIFVVSGGWGDDTITDFARGDDLIDLADIGIGFGDLAIASSGGSTLITYLDNSITLQEVAMVDESDFVFA